MPAIPAFDLFLASFISFIEAIFVDWLPLVITAITNNPILLIFVVALPVCGVACSMFNRLVRSN